MYISSPILRRNRQQATAFEYVTRRLTVKVNKRTVHISHSFRERLKKRRRGRRRRSLYLALHVLGLFGGHICGRLKVQHGLALLFLILLLVLHLQEATQVKQHVSNRGPTKLHSQALVFGILEMYCISQQAGGFTYPKKSVLSSVSLGLLQSLQSLFFFLNFRHFVLHQTFLACETFQKRIIS